MTLKTSIARVALITVLAGGSALALAPAAEARGFGGFHGGFHGGHGWGGHRWGGRRFGWGGYGYGYRYGWPGYGWSSYYGC